VKVCAAAEDASARAAAVRGVLESIFSGFGRIIIRLIDLSVWRLDSENIFYGAKQLLICIPCSLFAMQWSCSRGLVSNYQNRA